MYNKEGARGGGGVRKTVDTREQTSRQYKETKANDRKIAWQEGEKHCAIKRKSLCV